MNEKKQKSIEHFKNISMPPKILYRISFIYFVILYSEIYTFLFCILKYIFIVDTFNRQIDCACRVFSRKLMRK